MPVLRIECTFADVAAALRGGAVPLLLADLEYLGRDKEQGTRTAPRGRRWVVATGFDSSAVYVHDPLGANGQRPEHMPIPIQAVDGGRSSAVLVGR